MKKTLVVYAFHKQNEFVDFFVKHGVFQDPNVTFLFVCNDPTLKVDVPSYCLYMNRENKGHDFGAWSTGLLTNNFYQEFNYYICINSSCMGPFVPPYCSINWVNIFTGMLNDTVKLVGPTINCISNPRFQSHVQSYMFATDDSALDTLIESGIFSLTEFAPSKNHAVYDREVRMSREILKAGWNIASMTYYHGVDFRFRETYPEDYSIKFLGDTTFPKAFFGETHHPYECIFMKANRGQNLEWLKVYTPKSL